MVALYFIPGININSIMQYDVLSAYDSLWRKFYVIAIYI